MEGYYTRCLIQGHPTLVAFNYESDINVVSQRLVEKLQLPTTFHLNQAWIKFSTWHCVKEVLCDIAPMDSCHLLLGWAWLGFKALNLDERSLCLRHEGHKMKLKFMTPRQVSKDQHRLKEKIEKERIRWGHRSYHGRGIRWGRLLLFLYLQDWIHIHVPTPKLTKNWDKEEVS